MHAPEPDHRRWSTIGRRLARTALGLGLALGSLACEVPAPEPEQSVTATTDGQEYLARDPATSMLENATDRSVYLDLCWPWTLEQSIEGRWVDLGPPIVCIVGGLGLEVVPGATEATPFTAPDISGLYRLRYTVGESCTPSQGPIGVDCSSVRSVVTPVFEVMRALCDVSDPGCRVVPAAPNYLCPDGVTFGGPSAECTLDPETGVCGYELLDCP